MADFAGEQRRRVNVHTSTNSTESFSIGSIRSTMMKNDVTFFLFAASYPYWAQEGHDSGGYFELAQVFLAT